MTLPDWTSPEHPVARREANLWRKGLRRWGWVLIPFMLLPCMCSGLCALSALPIAFDPDVGGWGFVIVGVWAAFMGVSVTSGLLQWGLGTAANVGGAIMIARERENQSWALLRLSALSIPQIIAAKTAAVMRVLAIPTIIGIMLIIGGSAFLSLAAGGIIVAIGANDPSFPPAGQFAVMALIVGGAVPITLYLVAVNLINMLYNITVGLATSAFARTSASAVALSFAVHFGINLFIFLPIQQIVSVAIQIFGGLFTLITQSPLAFLILMPLAFIVPVIMQILVGAGAFGLAVSRAKNIVE